MTAHLPFKPKDALTRVDAGELAALTGFGRALGVVWLLTGGATLGLMAALFVGNNGIVSGALIGLLFNACAGFVALASVYILLRERSWRPGWGRRATPITAAITLGGLVLSVGVMGALDIGAAMAAHAMASAVLPALMACGGVAVLLTTHAQARFQMLLLERGTRTLGTLESLGKPTPSRIDGRPWRKALVAYTDPYGRKHEHSALLRGLEDAQAPIVGDDVEILIDPQRPALGIAPALYAIERPTARITDTRSTRLLSAPDQALDPELSAFEAPLQSTLRPLPRDPWVALWLPRDGLEVGLLKLDGGALRFEPKDGEPSALDLDAPFKVHLSAHLLPNGEAEVNVALQPRGARLSKPPIRFKTMQPQARLADRLPLKQELWPCLEPADFDVLWAVIAHKARMHGEDEGWVGYST